MNLHVDIGNWINKNACKDIRSKKQKRETTRKTKFKVIILKYVHRYIFVYIIKLLDCQISNNEEEEEKKE